MFEFHSLVFNGNEVGLGFGSSKRAENGRVIHCVEEATDVSIRAVKAIQVDESFLVLAADMNFTSAEAKISGAVFVEDKNSAHGVSTW